MTDDDTSRMLLMAGLAMMGARGDPLSVLSQGGLFGLQDMNQQQALRAKLLEEQQQAEARAIAIQRAKGLQDILNGGGVGGQTVQPAGSQRSIVDVPEWKPQVPAVAPKSLAQKLLDAGFTKEAKDQAEAQGAIHGEAYGNIQVTASGKPYYMTKQGPRYVDDNSFVPREELHFADTGDRVGVGMDKFTGAVRSQGIAKGMSPAEKDASARGWADFNRGVFSASVPLDGGGVGAGFVTPKAFTQVPGTGTKAQEAPAGYSWKPDGTLEAIEGGPAKKPPIEFQTQQSGVESTRQALAAYKKRLADFHAGDIFDFDKRASLSTDYTNTLMQMKEAYKLGVLNGPDYMLMTRSLTDPQSMKGLAMSRQGWNDQIDTLDAAIERIGKASAKAHGQTPAAGAAPGKRVKFSDLPGGG